MIRIFFRELLDNLYDGIYFVDLNMVITYWNKGAEQAGRNCVSFDQ